jgi:hypothetical protein
VDCTSARVSQSLALEALTIALKTLALKAHVTSTVT